MPSQALATVPVPTPVRPPSVADQLIEVLHQLGVRQAFGLVGGAIAPLCDALGRGALECFQLRHEAGAMFSAIEASLASRRPTAVFVTTGPGLLNVVNGAVAARWEGAHVIVISGATSAAQRGRWAVQETSAQTMPVGLYGAGAAFDYAVGLEHPAELAVVQRRLASGFARPNGFVAHLSLPIALQCTDAQPLPPLRPLDTAPQASVAMLDDCARRLSQGSPVVWIGHGARHAGPAIRALVDRIGARVMCTPRGKGVFPETDPRHLGVTGCGGHDAVEQRLAAEPADHILVLGSKLGEFSTCWQASLRPTAALLHVDVDDAVFGVAHPEIETIAIRSEIDGFVRGLLEVLPGPAVTVANEGPRAVVRPPPPAAAPVGPVRPRVLLAEIQRRVVEGSPALVMAESGNAFAWTNHALRFVEPGRYRVSGLWGSMGHATSGVVGAALGRGGKAVALVGDGAMLMMNEVSAAVQYGAQAVWIVLDDAQMGIVDRGMALGGFTPFQTQLPATDFAALARALGAEGLRVETEDALPAALEHAMTSPRPVVVDVVVDRNEYAPFAKRVSNLSAMGARR